MKFVIFSCDKLIHQSIFDVRQMDYPITFTKRLKNINFKIVKRK